jgi:integrase
VARPTRCDASKIRNTLIPVRSIYRRAVRLEPVQSNPTTDRDLPMVDGKPRNPVTSAVGVELIAAIPRDERALWATALFAGLRLGELLALDSSCVDMANGKIRVERSYDPKGGFVDPKSKKGKRTVPTAAELRDYLTDQRLRTHGMGLVFGKTPEQPLQPQTIYDRARRAWREANKERAAVNLPALPDCTPHDFRHSYGTMLIFAGVNPKAVCAFMGRANITVTFDIYGHILPGSEAQAGALQDTYNAADLARHIEAPATRVA